MTDFAPGDRVHIVSLGTGLVCEARNGGRYLVEIKGRTMVVAGSQLKAAQAERKSRGKKPDVGAKDPSDPGRVPSGLSRAASRGSASLDLHGKTVEETIDALDVFLNDAFLDGRHEVRVIHGRGGGRLKAAVHKRLGQHASVRAFRLDPANPGVTIVSL
jgi:DNA mismatch repair protein MutS2